jgi:hypothetical protein
MIRQDLRQHAPAMRKMLSGTFTHPMTNEKNAMQGVMSSVSSNNWNIASLYACLGVIFAILFGAFLADMIELLFPVDAVDIVRDSF